MPPGQAGGHRAGCCQAAGLSVTGSMPGPTVAVGAGVGVALGWAEGVALGSALGVAVGVAVGVADGVAEGVAEGVAVGVGLGVGVTGVSVIRPVSGLMPSRAASAGL